MMLIDFLGNCLRGWLWVMTCFLVWFVFGRWKGKRSFSWKIVGEMKKINREFQGLQSYSQNFGFFLFSLFLFFSPLFSFLSSIFLSSHLSLLSSHYILLSLLFSLFPFSLFPFLSSILFSYFSSLSLSSLLSVLSLLFLFFSLFSLLFCLFSPFFFSLF